MHRSIPDGQMVFQAFDELRHVPPNGIPNNEQINLTVAVNEDVAHSYKVAPRHFGEPCSSLPRYVTSRLANDL